MHRAILVLALVVVACGGESLEGDPTPPAATWRCGQAWQAPTEGACHDVRSSDPDHLRILLADAEPPGVARAELSPGEPVDLWVTVDAPPPSPFHWSLVASPCE